MTQPIQEPGQSTRTDAKLTWGSNQLFRRPAPGDGGAPDLPFIRMTRLSISESEVDVASNTLTNIFLDDGLTNIYTSGNDEVFEAQVTITTDPAFGIRIKEPGIYLSMFTAGFTESLAGAQSSANIESAIIQWALLPQRYEDPLDSVTAVSGDHVSAFVMTCVGQTDIDATDSYNEWIQPRIWHLFGAGREVIGQFDICRIGHFFWTPPS